MKVMVYFDNFFSSKRLVEEALTGVDEVVVFDDHEHYSTSSKWVSKHGGTVKTYPIREGLFGSMAKYKMFRDAIVNDRPDKIISFGRPSENLASQADASGIELEIVKSGDK